MKVFLLLSLAIAAVAAKPFYPDSNYVMIPHANGMRLVDLLEIPEPAPFYDPATEVEFILFTRDGPAQGQVIRWDDPESIRNSAFNPNNPTRLTIHGWGGGANDGTNGMIRRAYFQLGDFNCITVDWSIGAGSNNYLTARNNVGPTGEHVGRFLGNIISATGQSPADITVIGFSLGGHVAGFTGKNTPDLGSIVALDAAGPFFFMNNPAGRVADTDARYVESIHTNAGLLGFDEPLGHANFYPNFGRSQPGCGTDLGGGCAHGRAVSFFAESITSNVGFWGNECQGGYDDILNGRCVPTGTQVRMGGQPLNTDSRGVFWFTTNDAAPFAQGRM